MFRTFAYVVPLCQTPGCDGWDYLDNPPAWPTRELALAAVLGDYLWSLIGGVLRCEACTDRLPCERYDHMWEESRGNALMGLTEQQCIRTHCRQTRLVAVPAP